MPKVRLIGKCRWALIAATSIGLVGATSAVFCQDRPSNATESPAANPAAQSLSTGATEASEKARRNVEPHGSPADTAVTIVEQPPVYYVRDNNGHLVPILGVSLDELRTWLRQKLAPAAEGSPRFNFQQISITGAAEGDHAELTAEFKIQTIDDQWVNVPLISGPAVLTDAAEYHGNGKHSVQFDSETSAYSLRLQGTPGADHELKLKFMVPIKTMGTQHRLEFATGSAAASHIVIDVPQSAIELQDSSGCTMAEAKPAPKGSGRGAQVQAWGLGGPLTLVWKEGAIGNIQPVLEATGQVLARIDNRSVQFDATLSVRSFGPTFERFRVRLPKGAQLTGGAPNGASYTLTAVGNGDSQLIEVQLPQKTSGPVDVRMQAENVYEANSPNVSLELAGFEVLEAAPHRQWGHIAVVIVGDWQPIWGPLNHVRQIAELPDSMRRADVVAGFEYLGQGASLMARMTPRKTRIAVEPEYVYFVEPRQIRLEARLNYTIHGAKTSSLEIALPGWTIDEVSPENSIDGSVAIASSGPTFSVPLAHPTAGALELALKAHRDLPAKPSPLEIKLPVPVADVTAPALVVLVPADNVRLAPTEGEQQGLSRPSVAPRIKLPPREQSPLFYRQEQSQAMFTGIMERLPQVVKVGIDSTVDLRKDEIQVQQILNYRVEHEPLSVLTLDVPKAASSNGRLELFLDGRAIAYLPVSSMEEETRSRIEVPLADPRSGAFQLAARFSVPRSHIPGDAGQPFAVPLLAPTGVVPERHGLTVQSDGTLRLAASEDSWELSDEPLTTTSPSGRTVAHFKALGRTTEIALAGRPEEPRNLANTVVDRAWVQTWVSGFVRQDRTTYRFTTTKDQLQLQLPREVPPTNIEMRLDHQLLATPISNDIKISVPSAGIEKTHVLEIRYQSDSKGLSNSIEAELPQWGAGVWVQRLYWQLVLPGDQHLVAPPAPLTPEYSWQWFGWGWGRQDHWSQAELEDWIGASPQDPLPQATNCYLFSTAGNPQQLVALTAQRWQLVLISSAIVLIVGLLLLKTPAGRQPFVVLLCAAVFLAVGAWLPETALLFAQAATLGLALLLLGALLQRMLARRRRQVTRVAAVHESSVFQRSSSPLRARSLSLAAASTTAGPGEVELPEPQSPDA